MDKLIAKSEEFDRIIEGLIAKTQAEYNEVIARVDELNEQLQEKDMQTDRSENASFQVAKDERDFKSNVAGLLLRRMESLRSEIGNHRDSVVVILGSIVQLRILDIDGRANTSKILNDNIFKIVNHNTGNAKLGLISIDSKVGAAINGAKQGDIIKVNAPLGIVTYEIERIY